VNEIIDKLCRKCGFGIIEREAYGLYLIKKKRTLWQGKVRRQNEKPIQ